MASITEILQAWCDETITDIIKQYDRIGLRASGKLEKSLKSDVEEKGSVIRGQVKGADYIYYLVHGRGKTKTEKKGEPTLREIIRQWIDDKGITPRAIEIKRGDETISYSPTKDTLSYMITAKIHRDGIKVPNEYNNGQLLSLIDITKLKSQIAKQYYADIRSDILTGYEKVNQKYITKKKK